MARVLIVDDKEENLYYLQSLLGAHGHEVESAHHGAEALIRARHAPPDLVISDLLMPVMDGYTLLRHWKADERLRRAPFIVYTATYTEPEDERLALNLGADAFILKPAEPDAFIERLRSVMTQAARAGAPAARSPDEEDPSLLEGYSRTLIRKLEEKTLQLEESNRALERDIAARRRIEADHQRLVRDLGERVKELRALHAVSGILADDAAVPGDLLTRVAAALPPAMLHPDVCAARVSLGALACATPGFRKTRWALHAGFTTEHGADGEVVVAYLEERPAADEGPFLREERRLIESIAGMLRACFERRAANEALATSQRRLRHILESVAEGIHGMDAEGRVTFENAAGATMLGWSEAEIVGRPSHALIHHHRTDGSDYPEEACPILRTLRDGEVRRVEDEVFFRKDGSPVPVDYTCSPVRDDDGRITGAVVCFRDVSRSKAAEEALRASEQRFRVLANATNDAIWEWDPATDVLWWNEGFHSLFGFDPATVRPTLAAWEEHLHPDDRERVTATVRDTIASGAAYFTNEYRFRRADGAHAWVIDRGHIIRDEAGRPVRLVGGMTDVTARRQAEERLRDQAALLDRAQDAILVRDLEHRVTYWNKSAERLYGWVAAEAIGRPVQELIYRDAAGFDAATAATLRDGEWVGELAQVTRGGQEIVVEGRWTLVRNADDTPRAIFAINTDVTEKKRIEARFLRAQRMESIGTLAGGIAHDLNNILAPVLMSVDLLQREVASAEARELVATLRECSQRGADLVRQVLTFARGIEGERVAVDIPRVVREIAKIAQETFPKNISLREATAGELWTVVGDPTQVHQVLMNLCVNARDAMPHGGILGIEVENTTVDESYAATNPDARPGDFVRIVVEDTGAGIPPAVRERMFEPFYTTKETGRGTGLGLSTTLAIVRSHGGFITAYSEPGRGTRFKVHLPAAARDTAAPIPAETETLPRGHGELVLVVDDEEGIRHAAQRTLERFGYRVVLANNGAEAVALYAARHAEIAVVLTDMAMPVMDGPSTIVALRTINPAAKVIGSTGLASRTSQTALAAAGVRHLVPKPYTAARLLTTLAEVLHGR